MNCLFVLFYFLHIACSDPANKQTKSADELISWHPITEKRYSSTYNFIDSHADTISNYWHLQSFFRKLSLLQEGKIDRVSVVHIGDSHIQTDLLTKEVRNGLQDFFGNAGRGFVFPYQLARTNGPQDFFSSSSSRWSSSRLSYSRNNVLHGLGGFGMNKLSGKGDIQINLRHQNSDFDIIRLFLGQNSSPSTWFINPNKSAKTYQLDIMPQLGHPYQADSLQLTKETNGFSIYSSNAPATRYFYGASLERSEPGVLYHAIGVNGAQYAHYNADANFWNQLKALKSDLYILSFGTNEAITNTMNEDNYLLQVQDFITHIKEINPKADILITTAADSYNRGVPNEMLERINLALQYYCRRYGIALWDLYGITGGYGSAKAWLKHGLYQTDKIHYQAKAYELQGNLLFDALADGFNRYIKYLEQVQAAAQDTVKPLARTVDK
ncbi:GDSL-type esterase/lipase family protein [Olivibacter sitiensis]|uniref:GDSL-type esterase/lipase family protein n=1 Tax=Olivibacter sitiensis TaxID=376470 RepID=UPI00146F9B80|nr:GDSL-type esterase/lipase family protein [Olivibacter sitiensis]